MEIERVAVTRTKDNVLVGRAQRGDRDAFALLIEPRAGHLLHTARAILGDNWDAYEAAQETLIAAWVQLPTLRDADRVDAYGPRPVRAPRRAQPAAADRARGWRAVERLEQPRERLARHAWPVIGDRDP